MASLASHFVPKAYPAPIHPISPGPIRHSPLIGRKKKTRLQSEPPLKVRFLGSTLRGSSKRQVLLYSVIPYSFSYKHLSRGTSRLTLTHKRR